MCLSIPAKVLEITDGVAKADSGGNIVECDLSLTADAQVGDYVLVHAGYAIQKYDDAEAQELLRLLKEALGETP